MTPLVIDAGIAIKWVVQESDTALALNLLDGATLVAPDLLIAECANILWKKVRRAELTPAEALQAAQLLQAAPIELVPAHPLFEAAVRIAIEFDHPAYDCLYLALAAARDCRLVTADEHFVRKFSRLSNRFRHRIVPLAPPVA